ncbi:ATP-binding protein [Haladaptatus sp. NG-WS-4]
MESAQEDFAQVDLSVRNIGGSDETEVTLSPGVTAFTGRNAMNRMSFLQAIMTALGCDQTSLKGDAKEGRVELTIGDETYMRSLARRSGTVTMIGNLYLDDPELAGLFAFLLESNKARRAIARGDYLRDLIMRPVDTDANQAEIEQFETEKRQIDDELAELDSLEQQLPGLEEERTRLETEIEEKLDELSDTRSRLEDIRFKISTEE